jgi:hypothetical protein
MGDLERANLNQWAVIQFPKRYVPFCLIEYETLCKVQEPSNPECYAHHQNPLESICNYKLIIIDYCIFGCDAM